MAITSAICNSFKVEILKAVHDFTATSGNTFNLALYTSSATSNKSTTAYSTSNEISNTSGSALDVKEFPPVVYPVEVEETSLVFVGSAVPSVGAV